jgi:hypothetical protein
MKLSRKQIKEGLQAQPMEAILMGAATPTKRLTQSQIRFAEQLAMGKTKAEAYRRSRPNGRESKAKPQTASKRGQELAKVGAIQAQADAFKLALEARKHATPEALRALVIEQLTAHAINENNPPAQRLRALELLGKVTEVAAFTERRETRQVVDASVLRAKLLDTLQAALGKGIDAHDVAGRSLLQELGRVSKDTQGETIEGDRVVMDSAGDGAGAQACDARAGFDSLELASDWQASADDAGAGATGAQATGADDAGSGKTSAQPAGADAGGNSETDTGATPPTRHPPDFSEATPPPLA